MNAITTTTATDSATDSAVRAATPGGAATRPATPRRDASDAPPRPPWGEDSRDPPQAWGNRPIDFQMIPHAGLDAESDAGPDVAWEFAPVDPRDEPAEPPPPRPSEHDHGFEPNRPLRRNVWFDAMDELAVDTPCDRCGYCLRGLGPDQDCPECSHPVHASLREADGWVPEDDAHAWRQARFGLRCIGYSLLGTVIGCACVLALLPWTLAGESLPLPVAALVLLGPMLEYGLFYVGVTWVAGSRPSSRCSGREQLRHTLAWAGSGIALIGAVLLFGGIAAMMLDAAGFVGVLAIVGYFAMLGGRVVALAALTQVVDRITRRFSEAGPSTEFWPSYLCQLGVVCCVVLIISALLGPLGALFAMVTLLVVIVLAVVGGVAADLLADALDRAIEAASPDDGPTGDPE